MKRRPPGRPTLDASGRKSADVHVSLTPQDFDAVDQHARTRRESVQDLIRRGIKRLIADERGN